MQKNSRFRILLLILISFLSGYYFGINKVSFDYKNYKPQLSVISKEPPAALTTVDFSHFWIVWQKIQTDYYDKSKVDGQKMLNGAISGMVQSLGDPFTLYLPKTQNNNFKEGLAGQFTGIGAELGTDTDKNIMVIAPLEGSRAIKSGIKASDIIVKVNGVSTVGWSLSDAVEKIRGPKGTKVTITIFRKNETGTKDIIIMRDVITIKSVDGWVKKIKDIKAIKLNQPAGGQKDESVAYIRLSQFGDMTNQDWGVLVAKLNGQIARETDFKGLILDLRNNPGGYLSDAVFIASEFLNKNELVVSEEMGNLDKQAFFVTRKGLFMEIPVVVLINKGSASASEIVAGALRDHKRARLIGETSFGKGTVQTAEDLGNGAGLHVTIAKWLTPSGTWVHEKGLTPNVVISLDAKDPAHDSQLEKAVEELLR